jgi:thiol-disulfide isomerase/thioredoxin
MNNSNDSPLDNFLQIIDSSVKPVFVFFTASFCQPCKRIKPAFEECSKNNDNILFVIVDIVDGSEISSYYQIQKIPIIKIFHEGKVVDEINGPDVDKFNKMVEKYSSISPVIV